MRRLLEVVGVLTVLLLAACADSQARTDGATPELAQPYRGSWEYRYGDSPRHTDQVHDWGERAAQGTFLWAQPEHDDGSWQPAPGLSNPPGRGDANYLWLRTQLSGPRLRDATLFLPMVDERCEVYLDGRPIGGFGSFDQATLSEYPGKWPIYLRLGERYAGKMLVIRLYSPYQNIGVFGQIRLASRSKLQGEAVQDGLGLVIVGAVLIVMGLGVFALFLGRRSESSIYFLYSVLLLTIGATLLARTPMRVLIGDMPLTWRVVELVTISLLPGIICLFVSEVLGRGPLGIMDWLAGLCFATWNATLLAVVLGLVHIERALLFELLLLLLTALGVVVTAIIEAWHGSTDARLLGAGLIVSSGFVAYDALMWMQILPLRSQKAHYAAVVFVLSLGLILVRRFFAMQKRLADLSTVLQVSFAAAYEGPPGQYMQIALGEVLRLLSADRALLFLTRAHTAKLELIAGRDVKAGALDWKAGQRGAGFDARLVATVQSELRPRLRESWYRGVFGPPRASDEPLSVMAVPLLIRGQLQGVLYLEAQAEQHAFGEEDVQLLLGLGNQILLTVISTRAVRLEVEGAQNRKRLDDQIELLVAVARMAEGDLQTPIEAQTASGMAPLAHVLDAMRQDIQAQIRQLQASNAEVRELNEEFRHQLEQRSQRLIDMALREDTTARISASSFAAGQLLTDCYRIVRQIGQGASGQVFEVERIPDGRRLAAKVLTGRVDRAAMVRFAQEAQLLARVRHPNLISVFDVDVTAGNVLFIITELVNGAPLQLCADRCRDLDFVLPILQQIAAALSIVHDRAIVHRDLKPANVLIAMADGMPMAKLLDFGFAMLISRPDPVSAGPRESEPLLGTPMYMAPELVDGSRHAHPTADVWSFGVIAYELLIGELPFSIPPVVRAFRKEPIEIPSLIELRPDLPRTIGAIITRCLHLDRGQRPLAREIYETLCSAAEEADSFASVSEGRTRKK